MPYDRFVYLQLAGADEHSKTRNNYAPDMEGHIPLGFLRVAPDLRLAEMFQLPAPVSLYGRTNQLLDAQDRVLASIVEVLRPV